MEATEHPEELLLKLVHKSMTLYKSAANLLYAEGNGQGSILYFLDGEKFTYPYRLSILWKQLAGTGLRFWRVHRSFIVRMREVVGCKWLKARLSNGHTISVNRTNYPRVKEHLQNKDNR